MRKMPSRQVHLDFHTSPMIPGVGEKFDKAQFQKALAEGNLNSITVFAKCHHGYCYYPTNVGTQHPTMDKSQDLTGLMVEAAHEIGVAAPIYITAGWSALDAEAHPEWLMCDKNGAPRMTNVDPNAKPDDPRPNCSWKNLCLSGDYAEHIYETTREICGRYKVVDGLFYDIVFLDEVCYCPNCIKAMKEKGFNPDCENDAKEYYRQNHLHFMRECARILHEKHPEATIFFNGGAEIYRPEYHPLQSHIEMEDLPTTWGGYDKMPARASFMTRYDGKDYLGMTGKFHTSWGEFGGYKNPDALKFEALMMAMYGAKCSIGDQMPPSGVMDIETYKVIGCAYRALEAIEPWAYPAKSTADLGVYLCGNEESDQGLHSMLLESHIDFEIAMPGDDLSRFKALILPDCVKISEEEAGRIEEFIKNGG
ncbi:MAG: beta-galactosidase, partial [Clostridia bacterium]|nr:beta-galactosidase [Clostridia bacterium]